MKLITKTLISIAMVAALTACSSGESNKDASAGLIGAPKDNQDLHSYLQTDYLWNDTLPAQINPSAWASMPDAMDALRAPQDRFSFVMTNAQYADYVASVFFGYGFSHQFTSSNDGLRIRYVFDQGSAAQQGLRRGDIITHVAGISIADAVKQQRSITDLFGPNQDGFSVDVRAVKPDGTEIEASITKRSLVANTVMATQVKDVEINGANVKVGYLVFDSFKESSESELAVAFNQLAQQGAQELILDLRYNQGGRVNIAQQLSQQIAGSNVDDQVFVKFIHNARLSSNNQTEYFADSGYAKLNLDRVVVLTSEMTCSASELVMNALDPFIEVIAIGDKTCGKPIGMYPREINDWTVFAINFQTVNAVDFGDYFDGIPADCTVAETIPGDWGDTSEAMLAEGIHYLQNDRCSNTQSLGALKAKAKIDFSQGPLKVRNAL